MMDYTRSELYIKSQAEFDAIPDDYRGRIFIEFGSSLQRAVVKRKLSYAVVVAYGNSSVEAWGTSSVVAWDNSSVDLNGYAQGCIYNGKSVAVNGEARAIYPTAGVENFVKFYSVRTDGEKSIWYKAVHKTGSAYTSDYDRSFIYKVGKVYEEEADEDVETDCGFGLHIATMQWAIDYGKAWDDLAILEVEADNADIIVPRLSRGKVRAKRIKVLREVPLGE